MAATVTRTYRVSGMSCAHCAGAIDRDVAARAAIDEAGYAVVG